MSDTFLNVQDRQNPADEWFAITPGPDDLSLVPRGILVVAAGNITMADRKGATVTLTDVPANTVIPMRPVKVTAATATIFGLI